MQKTSRYCNGPKWCAALLLCVLNTGCGNGRHATVDGGGRGDLPPTVISVIPAGNAMGVSTNTAQVVAAFSEPMAPISGVGVTFVLTCLAPCVSPTGTVTLAETNAVATLSLTPGVDLAPVTTYSATMTGFRSSATDLALALPFVWHFTTGVAPDMTAPTVSSTNPVANASGTAINGLITAGFSEAMDPLSVSTVSFTLACPAGAPIPGTVGYSVNGSVATFTPAVDLPADTLCTAAVSTTLEDVAGNALAAPYSWNFTTGAVPDTTAPTVRSTTPLMNATGVAINSSITASFSEPMDPLTITTASFALVCPTGQPITGAVAYAVNGNVATFTPGTALPASTICTATLAPSVTDVARNPMAATFSWQFTTGVAPDLTAPTVSSTSPVANASGTAINGLITASFSEAMDPLTVTTATFTLACPTGTPITGIVGYAVNGNVASFTPAVDLPASTLCTAAIGTSLEDIAGNALALPYVWHFTTGAVSDTTAPTMSSTSPVANASGTAINALITASFSEPMDPLTITTTSFTLNCPAGTPTTGTVGYAVNGSVATFTPAVDLPASTFCTARLSTAVADVAGNALTNPFSWQFTTGVAPDTTAPQLSAINPADAAVGVCINKTINAVFSEPMDPLTITTGTFTLSVTAGAAVPGTVTYDAQSRLATFNPGADLIGNPATSYTASIKGGAGGVKDEAGNSLAIDSVTTFTTNASTCTTAPALGAAAPFGGFGGNATLTNDGLTTVINGDVGVNAASTTITGLRDSAGNLYTTTPNNNGLVNGLIYTLTAPPGSVPADAVTQGRFDAAIAFNSLSPANLPGGLDVSSLAQCPSCGGVGGGPDELAGRTLPPGVYLSATGTYDIGGAGRTSASLTLDAGGDANSVWVFQTAAGTGTLNVGLTGPATPAVPIKVLLINGARAKNVFWYVPAGAVIGTGATMTGTLLANAAITFSTTGGSPPTAVITTLNGRAIALTAGVTMTNTVVNVPGP